jgi:membrane carboxypeptidase/penicillin-binding protein
VLEGLQSVAAKAPGNAEWTPRNAHDDNPDRQTLRQALYQSNNAAAVALQLKIGSGAVLSLARDLGLQGLPDVPSLALGTGLVTPLDLTAAYAAFPNGGKAVRPRSIVRVIDADGQTAFSDDGETRPALRPEVAYQLVSMLRDVIDQGTGSAARAQGVTFPAGGKTGTTSDFKDAWFVGFSSAVVVSVWVGYDQPAPIGGEAYGARVALPIWSDFMRRTARLLPPREFAVPDGMRPTELCRVSYLRPVEGCPTYIEYLKEGDAVPRQLCPLHEGSFKQEVHRAVDSVLASIGKKLRDIFR